MDHCNRENEDTLVLNSLKRQRKNHLQLISLLELIITFEKIGLM